MLKNFKIAFRFLAGHKEYSLINLGGLSMSLVCVFFIALYVFDELSFDRFNSDSDRIYRVIENRTDEKGEAVNLGDVAFLISSTGNDIPSVENTFKFTILGRTNISNDENTNAFYKDIVLAEQSFFDVFDYELLRGDRTTALKDPNTIILTQSMAEQLFGTIDALGKTVKADFGNRAFLVTGVIKNFPSNSHLNFDLIFSMASVVSEDWYKRFQTSDWTSNFFTTYYKLNPEANPGEIEAQLTSVVGKNLPKDAKPSQYMLQPLPDIHFHSGQIRGGFNARAGEIYYVYIFTAVGFFILLIACVNYINLSTALSITRGKEVGVKKVAGANRSQLITQFITESLVIVFAAVIVAISVVNILLPSFNEFARKGIEMDLLYQPVTLAILIGFTLLVGFVSGSYPALHLSKLKPVLAIKGFSRTSQNTNWIRKGLVVFQFTLSITLIIASITAYRQIEFIRNKNLGFNKEQLVVLDINSGKVRRGSETIKNELIKIPGTRSVAVTSRVPGEWKNLAQVQVTTAVDPKGSNFYFIGADDGFLQTFEIELKRGRNFIPGRGDSLAIIINETAASALGVSDPGDMVTIPALNLGASNEPLQRPFQVTIIGIVKDFHFQSLHQKIEPLVIGHSSNPVQSIDYFTVRLTPGNWEQTRQAMEKIIRQIDNNHLLEYNFLDDRLADFYREDLKRSQIFAMAAGVSIALACLGLFSLASFSTEQRTKEIGIRKVLGASVTQITSLLSREYVKLVAIGFLLSIPLSIWSLQSWLSSFAYRIELTAMILITSGLLSIIITFFTVGYKSIRAALANPVDSLRSE